MTKNHMTCPNCNAEIAVDRSQMFVYCMYCGVKIQTRDIVEVRHVKVPESLEKMVADGETYLKVEEYYLAERKFREAIKQYPQKRAGYEGLIRTLTRNETIYPLTHETELFRLLYEAEQVAPKEERSAFREQRERMIKAFDAERVRVEQALSVRETDVEKQRKNDRLIYSVFALMILLALVFFCLLLPFLPPLPVAVCGIVAIVWLSYSIWKER